MNDLYEALLYPRVPRCDAVPPERLREQGVRCCKIPANVEHDLHVGDHGFWKVWRTDIPSHWMAL